MQLSQISLLICNWTFCSILPLFVSSLLAAVQPRHQFLHFRCIRVPVGSLPPPPHTHPTFPSPILPYPHILPPPPPHPTLPPGESGRDQNYQRSFVCFMRNFCVSDRIKENTVFIPYFPLAIFPYHYPNSVPLCDAINGRKFTKRCPVDTLLRGGLEHIHCYRGSRTYTLLPGVSNIYIATGGLEHIHCYRGSRISNTYIATGDLEHINSYRESRTYFATKKMKMTC